MTFNDRFIDFARLAGPPRPLFLPIVFQCWNAVACFVEEVGGADGREKQSNTSLQESVPAALTGREGEGCQAFFFLLQKNAPAAPCNIRTDHTVNVSDINYFLCPLALLVGTSCSNFLALCLHSSTQTCCCPFFHFFFPPNFFPSTSPVLVHHPRSNKSHPRPSTEAPFAVLAATPRLLAFPL